MTVAWYDILGTIGDVMGIVDYPLALRFVNLLTQC
jgi:hypothetical protein